MLSKLFAEHLWNPQGAESSHLLKYPVRMHQTISNVKTQLITLISTGTERVARCFCERGWSGNTKLILAQPRESVGWTHLAERAQAWFSKRPIQRNSFSFHPSPPTLISRTSSVVRVLIIPVHGVWIRRARNVILSFRLSVAPRCIRRIDPTFAFRRRAAAAKM